MALNLPTITFLLTNIKSPSFRYQTGWDIKKDKNQTDSTDDSLDTLLIDNHSVSKNIYESSFSLFNKVSLKQSASEENAFYNRNKVASAQGSLYKRTLRADNSISYPVFSFLKNTEYVFFESLNQYKTDSINTYPSDLRTDYEELLSLDERIAKHESQLKLFKILSVTGKAEYKDYTQKAIDTNTTTNSFFSQRKGSSGIILTPLSA